MRQSKQIRAVIEQHLDALLPLVDGDRLHAIAHRRERRVAHTQAPLDQVAQFQQPHPQPIAARFGPIDATPWLELLAEDGVLYREGERWEWVADSYPAGAVSLRSVADGNFVVVDRTNGKQNIIAEVDFSAAAVTLYEGAIHLIQAVPYQVERLDWAGRKAYVTRTQVDYYTDAIDYSKLKVLDCFDSASAGCGQAQHGEVHVVRRVAGYKKIRYYSHENIGYGPVNLPDQELHTTAVWWQLPQSVLDAAFTDRQQALDGFLGAACALHLVATVAVMAEQRDLQKSVGSGDGASVRQMLRHLKNPQLLATYAIGFGVLFNFIAVFT